jgi:hypothetical protein
MAGLDPSPGRPKAKYNGSAPASEDRDRRRAGALRSWNSGHLPYWPRGPPACSIDLGFLGPSRFCPGRPENKGWISLDSLVRIETFQWVTPDFWRKKISRDLCRRGGGAGTGAGILTMQKRSLAHRASLTHFLLFCNQLPSTEIVDSLSSSPTGRLRGLSAIISDTSLNPQLYGNR